MFNINIANERLYDENFKSTSHDLMAEDGVTSAYQRIEEINDAGDTYIIVEIENEWNYFDGFALIDQVVETASFLKKMDKEQQEVFKAIAEQGTEHPFEISNRVFQGTIISMDDVKYESEKDIWAFTEIDNVKVAVTY